MVLSGIKWDMLLEALSLGRAPEHVALAARLRRSLQQEEETEEEAPRRTFEVG